MRTSRLVSALCLVLALALVPQIVAITDALGLRAFETAERKVYQLEPDHRTFLEGLEDELFLTYYKSPSTELPSAYASLARDVERVLERIREAAPARVHVEIVEPESQEGLEQYLTELGVSKFRARRVEQDGWSEAELYSSLRIARSGHEDTILHAVTPELLPSLQRLVIAHARSQAGELEARTHFALIAPDTQAREYTELETLLGELGRVTRVGAGSGGFALPDAVDFVIWLEPESQDPEVLDALDRHVRSGRTMLLAPRSNPGGVPAGVATLLARYGVLAQRGVVVDGLAGEPRSASIRCTAHDQDFRSLGKQPNGDLHFRNALPLSLDRTRLAELDRRAFVLASTTSNGSVELTSERGSGRTERRPLLFHLESDDPYRGDLIVSASASPFENAAMADLLSAERGLVRLLAERLASQEQRVWNRVVDPPAPRLDPPSDSERTLWRALTVALVPGLLALIALCLGALRRTNRIGVARASVRVGLPLVALAGLGLVVQLVALVPKRADWTRNRRHQVSSEEISILGKAANSAPVRLETLFSDRADLPPELRVPASRARELTERLAAHISGVEALTTRPADAGGDERLVPRYLTSDQDEITRVRSIVAAVRVHVGDRSAVLPLTEFEDYDHLRFRIAFAVWRLSVGAPVRVAVAASAGRLSAAEDELDYREEGLFAPKEGDRFTFVRRMLERNEFECVEVTPDAPDPTLDPDVLLWLQPRRNIDPIVEFAARELSSGGSVVVAGQHYEIVPRQLRQDELELSFWPRPLHTDLDKQRGYFRDLGLELVREVFFDQESAPLSMTTRVERRQAETRHGQELEAQFSAQPFIIRSLASSFDESLLMRGVGDLVLPSANRLRLDRQLAQKHGLEWRPLFHSSRLTWSLDWRGGNLADSVLNGIEAEPGSPQVLGALIEGYFPPSRLVQLGEERTIRGAGEAQRSQKGRLILIGSSAAFRDEVLQHEEFGNGALLLNTIAGTTLPEDLVRILGRREYFAGFEQPEETRRIAWRLFVLGAGPLASLLLALLVFVVRRR